MYDFHTHTFLSDGVLSPIELIRRALVRGYKAIGVTDHVGVGNLEFGSKPWSKTVRKQPNAGTF
jgi:predicted metal-dependent phosphoesterase TrpH